MLWQSLTIVWLAVFLFSANRAEAQTATPRSAVEGHALLVGCSEYPVLRDWLSKKRGAAGAKYYEEKLRLLGPVNDVELMRSTLHRYLGFDLARIRVLAGWPARAADRPTKANILAEFARLERAAGPGDVVVVFFAGHGSRERDGSGDELDGYDEVLVPADAGPKKKGKGFSNVIEDDVVGKHIRAIRDRGARVRVIFDCCHAGTAMRESVIGRTRQIDLAELGLDDTPAITADTSFVESSPSPSGGADLTRVAALYAVQSHQKELELDLPRQSSGPRKAHGVFTFSLCQVLAKLAGAGKDPSIGEIQEQLLELYSRSPFGALQPIFEGSDARATFMGGKPPAPRALRLCAKEGVLEVDGGLLDGLEKDAILEVEIPGQGPLELLVTSSDAVRARCRLVAKGASIEQAIPAEGLPIRLKRRALNTRLALGVEDPGVRPAALKAIEEMTRWRLVNSPVDADWFLRSAKGGYSLEAAGSAGARGVDIDAAELADALRRIGRFETTLRVADRWAEPLMQGLVMTAVRIDPSGRERRLAARGTIHPGDRLQIYVQNRSRKSVDVNIFYFDSAFGISFLWPRETTSTLSPDESKRVALFRRPIPVNDVAVGTEYVLAVACPIEKGRRRLGTRLEDLCQEGFSGMRSDDNPVTRLLLETIHEGAMRSSPRRIPRFGMKLTSLQTAWPRLALARSRIAAFPLADGADARTARALPDGSVDPRELGPDAAWLRGEGEAPPDALISGRAKSGGWAADAPRMVLLDIDRDSTFADERKPSAGDVASFDYELAIKIEPNGESAVGYDRDGAGGIDLILVDNDADPEADVRLTLREDTWTLEDFAGPLVSTQYLEALRRRPEAKVARSARQRLRQAVTKRLRAIMGR